MAFSSQNAVAEDKKITFELARIDGSKFISNRTFAGKKTILFFFSHNCPPCVEKLKLLEKNPYDLNEVGIAVINLLDDNDVKKALLNIGFNPQIELLQAPSNPQSFLRKFGNNSGALPYLILLGRDGNICQIKTEMFNETDLGNC